MWAPASMGSEVLKKTSRSFMLSILPPTTVRLIHFALVFVPVAFRGDRIVTLDKHLSERRASNVVQFQSRRPTRNVSWSSRWVTVRRRTVLESFATTELRRDHTKEGSFERENVASISKPNSRSAVHWSSLKESMNRSATLCCQHKINNVRHGDEILTVSDARTFTDNDM